MNRIKCIGSHLTSASYSDMDPMSMDVSPSVVESFDVVVVGGGIFGSWSAIELANKGCKVALIDAHEPGHEFGSSHGDGRVFRQAYVEDIYVDMMLASLPKWEFLEDVSQEKLFHQTGGVFISKIGDKNSIELEKLYIRRGLEYQRFDSESAAIRFPQFSVPKDCDLLYQKDQGVHFATKCVKACWKYAETCCQVFPNHAATKFENVSDGVLVQTNQKRAFHAKNVVLAPGAWLTNILKTHFDIDVPTKVTAEVVSYFSVNRRDTPNPPDHSYNSMPVFLSGTDNGLTSYGYYGLPQIDIPGVKMSAHYGGFEIRNINERPAIIGGGVIKRIHDERDEVSEHCSKIIDSNSKFAMEMFPYLDDSPFRSEVCLYTNTYDHDFVISKIPGRRIFVAGGGSGHGFKHAPAIGCLISNLVLGEKPIVPVEKFSITRKSLMGSDPKNAGMK